MRLRPFSATATSRYDWRIAFQWGCVPNADPYHASIRERVTAALRLAHPAGHRAETRRPGSVHFLLRRTFSKPSPPLKRIRRIEHLLIDVTRI
ncbi:hypothetical protein Sfum_2801 [Syntrophobacter fumaroxidans MPOB]|uniref:Uncharacterized protein n=1 Tax=Syntrophobacter fumaroxidans (strain DSM 10017 / MPOB) TaxID=335543 RepID=A0LM27_SYNFM|nr:hypothetical protein Sfum_2801 [Syntrophobacter fumaroxidans MPOB]